MKIAQHMVTIYDQSKMRFNSQFFETPEEAHERFLLLRQTFPYMYIYLSLITRTHVQDNNHEGIK